MKRIFMIILTAVFSISIAEDIFYVDYASFMSIDKDRTKTEIYVSIPVANLEFDEDLLSQFSIHVNIYDGDELIAEDEWKKKYRISNKGDKYSGAEIPVLSRMDIAPGNYRLSVVVKDLNSGKEIDELTVPQESGLFKVARISGGFSMSSVQLASKIITDNIVEKSEFYKQGVIILPNPSKIFGTRRPFIYFYNELYGLEKGDNIEYFWRILDIDGTEIKSGERTSRKSTGETLVLADRVSVPSLMTGAYKFILNVKNKRTGDIIEGSNNFYTYRKLDFEKKGYNIPETASVLKRDSIEIEIMKDKDVEKEFEQVMITLDSKDRSKFKKLLLRGKREYLKRYWTEEEKENPGARIRFKENITRINSEYSTSKKEGWKTDRGRIYLKMGPPDRIDKETYNTEYEDHEVWNYFNGNYTFVFADEHGLGEFKLIHSDYPGEKNDPGWKSKLKKRMF